MQKIKMGIVGYGNIGRAAEDAIKQNPNCELVAVFTRRNPEGLGVKTPGAVCRLLDDIAQFKGKIDVLLLCGGSKSDLPEQTPMLAKDFNVIDTFDTHANIPQHMAAVDKSAKEGGNVGMISVGWDPGLFSMLRLLEGAVLPCGADYTFWGKGVSQGHSDAIRRIDGVANAIQYTIPVEDAVNRARSGEQPKLTTRQKHTRECFVVAKPGADLKKIEQEIVSMPNYFADYDTTVHFVTEEELKANHSKMPHGGMVMRSGVTSDGSSHIIEFKLNLESNPSFTSSVLVAFARAAVRFSREGKSGAFTPFDVPLSYLLPIERDELIKNLL